MTAKRKEQGHKTQDQNGSFTISGVFHHHWKQAEDLCVCVRACVTYLKVSAKILVLLMLNLKLSKHMTLDTHWEGIGKRLTVLACGMEKKNQAALYFYVCAYLLEWHVSE